MRPVHVKDPSTCSTMAPAMEATPAVPRTHNRPIDVGCRLGAPDLDTGAAPRSRRAFLKIASALSASMAALLAGVPTLRAFLSPALTKPPKKGWIKVGQAD